MKKKKGFLGAMGLAVLWGLFAFWPAFAENQSVLLRFQPKEGQMYRTVESINFKMKMPNFPLLSHINISYGFGYTYQILNVEPDGEAMARIKIHAVTTELSGLLGAGETYDSTDPLQLPSQPNLPFALMEGAEIEMKLDPGGRVTELHISELYQNRLMEYLAGNTEAQKAKIRETIQQSITQQMGKSSNQFTEGIYRPNPVAIGEKWTQIVEQNANGIPMKMKVTYRLTKITDGVASIDCSAKLLSFENSASDSAPQFDDFKGNVAGKIEVLVDSGYILRSNLKLKIEAVLKIKGSPSQHLTMEGQFLIKPFEEIPSLED